MESARHVQSNQNRKLVIFHGHKNSDNVRNCCYSSSMIKIHQESGHNLTFYNFWFLLPNIFESNLFFFIHQIYLVCGGEQKTLYS